MAALTLQRQAMQAALEGQIGGRRHPELPIAWYVARTATPATSAGRTLTLHIAKWAATGRAVRRSYTWPWSWAIPKTETFEAFGKTWRFDAATYGVYGSHETPPQLSEQECDRLRWRSTMPLDLRDAPVLGPEAQARAKAIKQQNDRKAHVAKSKAVFDAWPAGFRMLPVTFGCPPLLYQVRHDETVNQNAQQIVEVREPRRAVAKGVSPFLPTAWRSYTLPVYSKEVTIKGVRYVLAPTGADLYRPGAPEDAWSFAEVSAEAEMRFAEMRPLGSLQLPGHLAWYVVAEHRHIVRITWYNSRRETVHEYVTVTGGGVVWRNHFFSLKPNGTLEVQA